VGELSTAVQELRVAVEEFLWHSVMALALLVYAAAVVVYIAVYPLISTVKLGARAVPLRGVVWRIKCWRRGQ